MRLAVATHSFLSVFELTPQWEISTHHRIARGHHYGIAPAADEQSFLALRNARGRSESDESARISYRSTPPFDELSRRALPDRVADAHQAARRDAYLYVANTSANAVESIPLDGDAPDAYHFGGHTEDVNHVNSVYPVSESRLLALLHNANTPAGISEVAVLDHVAGEGFELVNRTRLWDEGCHNIFIDPPLLVYNASSAGVFCVYDLETNTFRRRLEFPGHTKGLAVSDSHFVIGYSEHASRDERFTSHGQLAVIDRTSLETAATIDLNVDDLPHPIGNINEVRLLDQPDAGHRNGASIEQTLDGLLLAQGDAGARWDFGWRRAGHPALRPFTALKELLTLP